MHDLRYALRLLLKSPSFTLIAIITLALGIGANSAIFTVVDAVLLRPLAFRDPSRLVIVAEKSNFPVISTSYQNWVDWRDQSRSFESMEATQAATMTLTGTGDPEHLMPGCQFRSSGRLFAHGIKGRYTSAGWRTSKPAGRTPTTVKGCESRLMDLPMILLDPPKRLSQRP